MMNSTIKKNLRIMLFEEVGKPTKLYVFDFDATLIDTPLPEEGREIWKEKHGFPFPSKSADEVEQNKKITGWWGRKESLDMLKSERRPVKIRKRKKNNCNIITIVILQFRECTTHKIKICYQ